MNADKRLAAIRAELTDAIEDPDITDENGCPCCLPLIYVSVVGSRILELAELAEVEPAVIERLRQRFQSVTDQNYKRIQLESENQKL